MYIYTYIYIHIQYNNFINKIYIYIYIYNMHAIIMYDIYIYIYIYIYISKLADRTRGRPEGSVFNNDYTEVKGGANSLPESLHLPLIRC